MKNECKCHERFRDLRLNFSLTRDTVDLAENAGEVLLGLKNIQQFLKCQSAHPIVLHCNCPWAKEGARLAKFSKSKELASIVKSCEEVRDFPKGKNLKELRDSLWGAYTQFESLLYGRRS